MNQELKGYVRPGNDPSFQSLRGRVKCSLKDTGCWAFTSVVLSLALTGHATGFNDGKPEEGFVAAKNQPDIIAESYLKLLEKHQKKQEPWIKGKNGNVLLKTFKQAQWTSIDKLTCVHQWLQVDSENSIQEQSIWWMEQCMKGYNDWMASYRDKKDQNMLPEDPAELGRELGMFSEDDQLLDDTWSPLKLTHKRGKNDFCEACTEKCVQVRQQILQKLKIYADEDGKEIRPEHQDIVALDGEGMKIGHGVQSLDAFIFREVETVKIEFEEYLLGEKLRDTQITQITNFFKNRPDADYRWGAIGRGKPRPRVAPFHWVPFGIKDDGMATMYDYSLYGGNWPLHEVNLFDDEKLRRFTNDHKWDVRFLMLCK